MIHLGLPRGFRSFVLLDLDCTDWIIDFKIWTAAHLHCCESCDFLLSKPNRCMHTNQYATEWPENSSMQTFWPTRILYLDHQSPFSLVITQGKNQLPNILGLYDRKWIGDQSSLEKVHIALENEEASRAACAIQPVALKSDKIPSTFGCIH